MLKVLNAKQLVRVCANKEVMKVGPEQNEIAIIENGALVCDKNGIIVDIGTTEEINSRHPDEECANVFDATDKCILPGLVDGHTHPVWTGDRVHEFAAKLDGATYLDIHKMGGGIGFTVEHTRRAAEAALLELLVKRLDRMAREGTTTVEAKSGYGLEMETEMKMLRVIKQANASHPLDIVSTFLGAHSVPKGSTTAAATKNVIDVQIPELVRQRDAGLVEPTLIDVFLEKGVFPKAEARSILLAGQAAGLDINFHGDEINYMAAGELSGELGATAMSHCEMVSDAGAAAMAAKSVVAVLLPTTAYVLRIAYPPARKLLDGGVPVAVATDFNPNAHCHSMPMALNLACVQMRMTMSEALVAGTINAAASIGMADKVGSLEVGKQCDLLVLDAPKWEHLIYDWPQPPIAGVVKKGVFLSK